MFRRIALDVDRRLRRIDPALPEGAVFFCTFDELVQALRSGHADVGGSGGGMGGGDFRFEVPERWPGSPGAHTCHSTKETRRELAIPKHFVLYQPSSNAHPGEYP